MLNIYNGFNIYCNSDIRLKASHSKNFWFNSSFNRYCDIKHWAWSRIKLKIYFWNTIISLCRIMEVGGRGNFVFRNEVYFTRENHKIMVCFRGVEREKPVDRMRICAQSWLRIAGNGKSCETKYHRSRATLLLRDCFVKYRRDFRGEFSIYQTK